MKIKQQFAVSKVFISDQIHELLENVATDPLLLSQCIHKASYIKYIIQSVGLLATRMKRRGTSATVTLTNCANIQQQFLQLCDETIYIG